MTDALASSLRSLIEQIRARMSTGCYIAQPFETGTHEGLSSPSMSPARYDGLLERWADQLASLLASVERPPEEDKREIEDMLCPWCGDSMNYLKPAGGCLIAEINSYAWHAYCADEYEVAKGIGAVERPAPEKEK